MNLAGSLVPRKIRNRVQTAKGEASLYKVGCDVRQGTEHTHVPHAQGAVVPETPTHGPGDPFKVGRSTQSCPSPCSTGLQHRPLHGLHCRQPISSALSWWDIGAVPSPGWTSALGCSLVPVLQLQELSVLQVCLPKALCEQCACLKKAVLCYNLFYEEE